ncbi:MAG: molybdopterin-dependent oxidoreductase, partial [Rhodocyclaceae bacterium]|nr:molybdopterin-dependent oxidoreductase [Rhodocyclaceae bacterium]
GSNTAYAHPIVFRRVEDARRARPHMKMIVVDPRRTDTAAGADLHLAILPGTDIWLYNAMLNVLLWEGYCDNAFIRDHTEGFDALREHVREITPVVAARVCGVKAEDIVTAARWWGEAPAALSMWCQGLNQSTHGTHNGAALIALSLATGKIGKPGSGPFSLTGQPNAMGGREVGGLANLLSAHRDMANPAHRAEVAALWGVESVPDKPGLTAVELFQSVRAGKVKALWVACTNPAHSLPEQQLVREALAACDFVVVQDAYRNIETAAYADLLLPVATWGEKEGTVTNSERRITHVTPALAAPGEARADWRIMRDFALALGPRMGRSDAARLFDYAAPEAVFAEHVESTRGRDLDITGLSYALLDAMGPQQWPYPQGATGGRARLYENFRFETPSGRARFVVPTKAITAESVDARFPLHLTTGRLRDQWHTMSRTGKVAQLYNHVEEARIDLHPEDLERRGVTDGQLVRVKSRRGAVILRARATDEVRAGQCFVSMHWSSTVLNSPGANLLMPSSFDPFSKQPELKHAAVSIEKVDLPYQALALRSENDDQQATARALERLERLGPWLQRYAYASLAMAGREHPAVVLKIAHDSPIAQEDLDELDQIMGLDDPHCSFYSDAGRGITKRALIDGGVLVGIRLTGETAASGWLRDAIVERLPTDELRRWLFAPLAQPPASAKSRGRIVCNCLNVSESEIVAEIQPGCTLELLQDKLKCGTSCGSCVPEIRRMLAAGRAAA